MIKIKDLTFSYNPREDRIIFIANHSNVHERVDLLVTRKKLIDLLNGFDEILINHCNNGELFKQYYNIQQPLKVETKVVKKTVENKGTKEVKNVKVQETKNQQKWEKSVTPNELQLTKINEPVLLDALSYKLTGNNFEFKFVSQNQIKAVALMSKESFQQTLSSLMRVIPFVSWGISPHILD
jgi:hypothetical protein